MPYTLHSEDLHSSWLDAYGHLNEGYYLVAFSNATWALQDHFEIGPEYTNTSGCALYTAETHLRYLREVRAPARLDVTSFIFGFDPKKLHLGHVLFVDGVERATVECLLVHVDQATGKSRPFMQSYIERFERGLDEKPGWVGSTVSLERRK